MPPSNPPPSERELVGLIGLGLVGTALAERLLTGGFDVLGFDISEARVAALRELGVRIAARTEEVAIHCRRIFLSLPESCVADSVIGEMGRHLRAGQIILDTTTGDPACAVGFEKRLAALGVSYLDATISGSSAQVRQGQAVFLVGASDKAFAECGDLFRTVAGVVLHTGVCGSGSKMKLVTNLVLGLNRAALAEGLVFARAFGMDPAQALTVLRASMAYSRVMDAKGEKMVTGDFEPQAKLSQHLKDVRLMLAAAKQANTGLPLTETYRQLLELAERLGLGQQDNSAILRAIEAQRPPEDAP